MNHQRDDQSTSDYKHAAGLPPGCLYVILPGVTFELPKKPAPTIDDILRK